MTASRIFAPIFLIWLAVCVLVSGIPVNAAADSPKPLSSWEDTAGKQAIIDFVNAVSNSDSPDYVPPAERIAVFDCDGTLIPEIPNSFMVEYAYRRFQTATPELKENSGNSEMILEKLKQNDLESAMALNAKRTMEVLVAMYARDDSAMLAGDVAAWLDQPYPYSQEAERRWRDSVYLPMLELMDYLRSNQFQVYLVTGTEQELARALAQELFNIPPPQVIGSEMRYSFEEKAGRLAVNTEPRFSSLNSGPAKALNISSRIGIPPLFAAGNSDNDLEMLKLTTQSPGRRLGMIIHHTDAEREFAYDRESVHGKLRKGLEQSESNGWLLIDMREDWKTIYPSPELIVPEEPSDPSGFEEISSRNSDDPE